MSNKFEAAKQIFKGGKYVFETIVPKISKNLTKLRKIKDEGFKSVDEKAGPNVSNQKKSEIKLDASKKVSKIYDKYEDATKKAKGGRVGLKGGTNPFARKSNIKKIQEVFGPKEKPQTRMTRKKKKFPDLTGDGKVTFADVLKGRGVINGKKKKTKKKFI